MQDDVTKIIATDLGIAGLPLEEQQQLITQFGEVALKAASIAVMEKMTEEKRIQFMTMAQTGDSSALKTFLDTEVPGHEDIARAAVADEVAAFKAAQAA